MILDKVGPSVSQIVPRVFGKGLRVLEPDGDLLFPRGVTLDNSGP